MAGGEGVARERAARRSARGAHLRQILVIGVTLVSWDVLETELRAQGGPPLRTDDPGTPGDGRWEVNLAFASENLADGWSFEAPLLDINYGVGERIQLKFELPWIFLHEEGDETRNGLGNSQIGVKWRFLDQATHGLDLSTYPQVEFNNPTSSADRGLVDEGSAWTLPFQAEKTLGPVSLNPEVGYVVRDDEDEWLYGLALGYPVLEGVELLGEVHGTAQSDFGDDELLIQAGGRWAVHRNLTLLAAVGRGIRNPREGEIEFAAYFGVQLLFGGRPSESGAPGGEG